MCPSISRAFCRALGPVEITLSQRCCRLFQGADKVIEDQVRGPLHHVPRVAREHRPDRESHPAPDQRVDKPVRRQAGSRGLERDRQQRRNPGLGDEQRSTTDHHGGSHSQGHHDPDLDRPRPDGEHE
jgi:hypothetical protein